MLTKTAYILLSSQQTRFGRAAAATFLALSLMILVDTGGAQAQRVWVEEGPGPITDGQVEQIDGGEVAGAVHTLAAHPTEPGTIYIGAVNGGIWKTVNATDASPHWEALVVGDGRSLSIGAIAFDPTDQHWQTLMAGSGRFSSSSSRGGAMVGVWLTTNGGATWKLSELAGRNISGVAPRGSTLVIAADDLSSLDKEGIWQSLDGGASWNQISGQPGTDLPAGDSFDLASDPSNNQRLYTNAGANGIYRSNDTGATWRKISDNQIDKVLKEETGREATNVRIAVGRSNNVYVAIVGSSFQLTGLFRSDDDGATWVSLALPLTDGLDGIHTQNQGHINMSIVADRIDPNVVYIGGDQQRIRFPPSNSIGATGFTGRLFRVVLNSDGHSQATPITHSGTSNNSAPHADSRDMEFDANNMLLETDDGGIYRRPTPHTNDGAWVSVNGDLRITELHSVAWDSNARIVIGGAWDTGTPEQSQTGSQRWRTVSMGDGSEVSVYDVPGFSERYSSFVGTDSAGSVDGGFRRRTCDDQNRCSEEDQYPELIDSSSGDHISTSKATRLAVNRVEPRRIVIGADSVYESSTYADTLTNIGPGIVASKFGGNAIAYGADDNADMLYVLTRHEVYIRKGPPPATLDKSLTYLGRNSVWSPQSVVMNPADSRTAYVVDEQHVYRNRITSAGEDAWDDITGDLFTAHTPGNLHALAYTTTGSLIVGGDNGVFAAEGPNFETWRRVGVGLPRAPVYDLDYDAADGKLVAALFGRGAWSVNLNEPDRGPADVMLVLDLSGSMHSSACSNCRPKLEVLQDSVEIFIRLFTAFAIPEDRLGVVYFRTGVSEFPAGPGVLVPALSNADRIIADVRTQTATGGTAMGGGLQKAIGRLNEEARPRHIVLFTDGMQNVNPMVDAATLVIANQAGRSSSGVNPTTPPTDLNAGPGIKVSTIGVGATPAFLDLLDYIAGETGGAYHHTESPDEDLREFYVQELIAVLRQFSPQLIGYRHGVASRDTSLETFTVNASARRVVLKLSWQRGDSMNFSVVRNGVDVTRFGRVISGPFYSIFAIDLPAAPHAQIDPAGDWLMVIRGPEGAKYEAAAIVEEERLKYDFTVGGSERVVGDPLPLNVRLSFAGRPVTDASVSARVLAPQQSLGALLSKSPSPVVPSKLLYEPLATDAQRKFQLLLAQDSFRAALQPTEFPITFRNNGDGTYSATFTGTSVSGAYTIIFRAEGQRPDIGKYDRTERRSVTLRFGNPSLDASELTAARAPQTNAVGNYELNVRPVDGLGNYLGPDYGQAINVSVDGVRVAQAPRDLLDGSYNFPLATTRPPALTKIVVTVLGRPLYEGTLADIHGAEAAPSRFAFSVHTGVAFPAKGFGPAARAGLLNEFDFEYRVTPSFSLEGVLGRYDFGTPGSLKSGSLFFKGYTPVGSWRAYGSAGPGIFWSQGSNARLGLSAGAGLNRPLNTWLEVDLGAGYSQVFRPGRDLGVVGLKAGVKFTF